MPVSHCPRNQPSRRLLLSATLAAPFIGKAGGAEPDFVLRVGHAAPATFPLHVRLIEAAGQINQRSQGKVQLQVFANSQLGSPIGMLAQVRAGTLDAAALSNQTLAADLVSMNLPLIGFAFSGYDRLWPAIDGNLGAMLTRLMRDRLGLVAAGRCWDFGFRQITTATKTIKTAADVAGMLIRTPAEPQFINLLQALHARAVTFSLGDLDKALQTQAVEGQQGMIELALEARLYLWQSHCALTNHMWDGHWLLFSRKRWDRLGDTLQGIVTAACDEAAQAQRKDVVASLAKTRAVLEKAGMSFNAVQFDSFRTVLRESRYYAGWRSRMPEEGWNTLETFTGPLA
jgi:TRAP-type C4-dicarboxylate transport system substrate-binding protein